VDFDLVATFSVDLEEILDRVPSLSQHDRQGANGGVVERREHVRREILGFQRNGRNFFQRELDHDLAIFKQRRCVHSQT